MLRVGITQARRSMIGAKSSIHLNQVRTFIYEIVPLDVNQELRLDFNVLKDAPPIVELPDAEYPEWLWTVTKPHPNMYEMKKYDMEEIEADPKLLKRWFKINRKYNIKDYNMGAVKN